MPIPSVTPLPTAPQRTDDPDTFILRADAFIAAMQNLPDEINAANDYIAALAASLGVSSADANILALAGLTLASNKGLYGTGAGALATYDLSSFVRSISNSADAPAHRTALGLGALAVLATINDGNWSGTDLAITNGGTGASSASAARTNLGLGTAATADATQLVPAGAVQAFAMNTAPSGWLECDGAAVSRTTYAGLFTAISTTFGTGDGSTTFNLPDLRGEFVRGWDHGKGTDSGRSFGSSQADELEAHTHAAQGNPGSGGGTLFQTTGGTNTTPTATESTGGTETRPRNIALLYAIKT